MVWSLNAGVVFAAVPCQPLGRGWVLFEVAPELEADFAEAARAHLAAELQARGVAVCVASSGDGPAALARVSVAGALQGSVTLRIEDDVAQTIVERRIDFAKVPPQGRALTFGLAADELLGVGWASVIAHKQATETPVVEEKTSVVTPAIQIVKADRFALLAINAATFLSGLRFAGPQLVLAQRIGRFVPELRAGLRWGNSLSATHGQASFSDLNIGVGASWVATPLHWNTWVGPTFGVELSRVAVRGEATQGASSQQGQAVGSIAHLGCMGVVRLSSLLRLAATITGGYTLVPVRAADAGQDLGGVAGFVVQASFGLGAVF